MNRTPLKTLFIPGNPAHARTQVPIAEELLRRGHVPIFLVRDAVIKADFHTAGWIDTERFTVHAYSDFYKSDIGRRLPKVRSYWRSKREVFAFLSKIDFDVSVSCNDTSALFDRLVLAFSRQQGKHALLVQESVRPAQRDLPLRVRWKQEGSSFLATKASDAFAYCLPRGPFVRQPYGHSPCTMIATAGDRFRRQLIAGGVPESKIRVTGQPRLDITPADDMLSQHERQGEAERVLLFCSQPIPTPQEHTDRLFRQIVTACDASEKVRLLVKLHPRDLPPEHWTGLLDGTMGKNLLGVTKDLSLDQCFRQADGMMTIASTTCLEAMAVGVPVALVNYLPVPWHLPYDEHRAVLSITHEDTLERSILQLLFDEQCRKDLIENSSAVLHDELYLRDGRSAERIVDFIEEQVDATI